MDSCYYYRDYKLPKGNLDPSVDCTYVLIMHDSPREHQIYQHIMKAEPTSRVVFQYNFGFKKCQKTLRENKPNIDLEDAYKTAFKHALDRGYTRILVLEDDCEFDERIRDPEIVEDLNTFFIEKNPDIYNLGTTFGFPLPTDVIAGKTHQLLMYNSASHADVYNDKFMKYAMDHDFMMGHSDFETNRHLSKYTYKFPLAYQKIVETENAKEGWGSAYFLLDNLIVKPSGIDKQVQPGYDNIKKAYDYISVICFVSCILLIVYLIKNNIRK
jgi:hypothetical protein